MNNTQHDRLVNEDTESRQEKTGLGREARERARLWAQVAEAVNEFNTGLMSVSMKSLHAL